MECRACELLARGLGGFEQDEHYGGCIPLWVETEDMWNASSDDEDIVERIEVLDIDTEDNESDMSQD